MAGEDTKTVETAAVTEETKPAAAATEETKTEAAPAVETKPEGAVEAKPEEGDGDDKPAGDKKPAGPKWFEKQINKKTFEAEEAKRQLAATQAELAKYKAAGTEPTADEPRALTEADVDQLANVKAARMAADKSFNDKCNAIAAAGTENFPDFNDAVNTLNMAGAQGNRGFYEAVATLEKAPDVLYHLGKHPEEASRILAMPSIAEQAVALARLETKITKPVNKPVSKAPAPINALNATATGAEKDPDKMTTAQWMEWRKSQIEARASK